MKTTKVSTRTGTVAKISQKKSYWSKGSPLVGITVHIEAKEENEDGTTTWTDSIEIPLGWVPEGLKIGSKLRVSVETIEEPVSQSGDYEGTIGIGSVLAEPIDAGSDG